MWRVAKFLRRSHNSKRLRRLVGAALAANEMVIGSKAHLDKSVFLCNHDIAGAS